MNVRERRKEEENNANRETIWTQTPRERESTGLTSETHLRRHCFLSLERDTRCKYCVDSGGAGYEARKET